MVLILDGNSEKGAQVRTNLCYLIWPRHLIDREQSQMVFMFSEKTSVFPGCMLPILHTVCPTSSDPVYKVSYYMKWVTTALTDGSKLLYKWVTTSWIYSIFLYACSTCSKLPAIISTMNICLFLNLV